MNASQLLKHFDRLAEAPDAVARLRRFILDLAVRGKLVEQDAAEEPAAALLKRIQVEKIHFGNGRTSKPEIGNAKKAAAPFEIPQNWVWTKLGDIADLVRGITFSASDKSTTQINGTLPCFRSGNIQSEIIWNDFVYVPTTVLKSVAQLVQANDILISIANSYELVGKSSIVTTVNQEATFGAFLSAIRLFLLPPQFIQHVLASGYSSNAFRIGSSQTTNIANITFGTIRAHQIPLPPLAEQHRIVAKVDELMALCDQLEAAQQERERRRDRLAAASLHHLNQPAADVTPEEQRVHARFHLSHLPRLITRPEQIKAMRQSIRSFAIDGRLITQDPSDESAAVFLKNVELEKAQLVKTGEIREAKSLDKIVVDATPFPLPSGWEWARFGALINHSDAGISPKTEGFARSGDKWGVLKVSAVSWDRFKPEENKQVFEGLVLPDFAQVEAGDFLISRANTRELVAKCVIVDDKPEKLILSDKTVRLRLTTLGNPRFWCLVNNHADYARNYYAEKASGTSDSMKNVSRPIIYNLLMPIPPLAEQHRIVAKVDELMALCDKLEAQLTITQNDSRSLLEAVLEYAL